jgi:hypothetical protein
MSERKQELQDHLETYYRECGWKVQRADDGTIRAVGLGGVTWIGLAVTADDMTNDGFEAQLADLAEQRMPGGELCPFELLPDEDCAAELREVLGRLRLAERGHVEIYSLAA